MIFEEVVHQITATYLHPTQNPSLDIINSMLKGKSK